MKKLILAVSLILGCAPASYAGISAIGQDIYDNTHLTLLKSANVAYFYDLGSGTDKNSQAGLLDHVFSYRFVSASIGWRTPTVGGTGILVAGPTFHLDKLLAFAAPSFVGYVNTIVPSSAQDFWDSLFAGLSTG